MCANMIYLKKPKTRIKELEEELKATREDYEEEVWTKEVQFRSSAKATFYP